MEEDIYGDLENFDFGDKITELEEQNNQLSTNIKQLGKTVEDLKKQVNDLSKAQEVLKINISSLYFTAKNEIQRKDRCIADLRRELDDLIFKRKKQPSAPSVSFNNGATQGTKRKQVTDPIETAPKRTKEIEITDDTKTDDYKKSAANDKGNGNAHSKKSERSRLEQGWRNNDGVLKSKERRSRSREHRSNSRNRNNNKSKSDKAKSSRSRSPSYDSKHISSQYKRRSPDKRLNRDRRRHRDDSRDKRRRSKSRNRDGKEKEKASNVKTKTCPEETNNEDGLLSLEKQRDDISKELADINEDFQEEIKEEIKSEVEKSQSNENVETTIAAVVSSLNDAETLGNNLSAVDNKVEKTSERSTQNEVIQESSFAVDETSNTSETSKSPQATTDASAKLTLKARRKRRCVITIS